MKTEGRALDFFFLAVQFQYYPTNLFLHIGAAYVGHYVKVLAQTVNDRFLDEFILESELDALSVHAPLPSDGGTFAKGFFKGAKGGPYHEGVNHTFDGLLSL